jgi:hypothetical protein
MLVLQHADAHEETLVVLGDARHDFEVAVRDQQLPGLGEAHDALRDVDAVADDVGLVVEIAHQAHRPEVDAETHRHAARAFAHRHPDDHRVLRIAEEHHRRAVAGIDDHAVAPLEQIERLGERAVEARLGLVLLGDRPLGVADEIEEQHAADERAAGFICHAPSIPYDPRHS